MKSISPPTIYQTFIAIAIGPDDLPRNGSPRPLARSSGTLDTAGQNFRQAPRHGERRQAALRTIKSLFAPSISQVADVNAAFASHLVPGPIPIRGIGGLMMILSGSARGRKGPNLWDLTVFTLQ